MSRRPERRFALTVAVVALVAMAGCASVVDGGGGDGEETTVERTVQGTQVEDPLPRDRIEDRISEGVRISGVTGELDDLVESEEPASYSDLVNLESDSIGIRFVWETVYTCGLAYNAVVERPTDDGGTTSTTVVDSGEPPGDPIRVTETVPVVVDDREPADTSEATVTVTAWPRREPSEDCAGEASDRQELRERAAAALSSDGLGELVRHWNGSEDEQTWAGYADPSRYNDGDTRAGVGYADDRPPTPVGEALNETLTQRGFSYNLLVTYENDSASTGATTRRLVFRGIPTEGAVVVSETVTLSDDQSLTGPGADARSLATYDTRRDSDDGYFPIPDVYSGDRYNEVTVYLVVW